MALQRVRSNMLANNFVLDDDQGLIVGSGNNLYIDTANNRVGINTTNPNYALEVNGDLHATGNITAGGNITLGDSDADILTITAEIGSDILPDIDNTYDLGSTTKKWAEIHATTFYGDGSQLTGLSSTLDEVTTNGDTTTNSITVGGLIVNSTGALGLPVGTTAERPTAADGLIRFNSDLVAFEGYDGVEWGALGGGGAVYANTAPTTNLKAGDLWFDTGTTGELYVYSGTEWLSTTGSSGSAFYTRSFTGDNSTTAFNVYGGTDSTVLVYINGILVTTPDDYSYSNGTVTFVTPPPTAAEINVLVYGTTTGITLGINDLTDVDITSTPPTNEQVLVWDAAGGKFVPGDAAADFTDLTGSIALTQIPDALITPVKLQNSITISDEFTATGSSADFTLSRDPGSGAAIQVFVDSVPQLVSNYTVNGTTLTLAAAPLAGQIVEVRGYGVASNVGVPTDGSVTTDKLANGSVTAAKLNASVTTDDIAEGSTNLYYTDTRVDARVALVVDSAPATLDTLNELAAALGDDPNFATTVSTQIGTKWTQDNTKITNWDTAYSWGDHSLAGYITSADGGNAATLDTLDSTQFMRSDVATTATEIDINQNVDSGIEFLSLNNLNTGTSVYSQMRFTTGTENAFIFKNISGRTANGGGGSLTLWNDGNYPISLYTNSQKRLHIDGNGDVGIGTESLSYRFEVNHSSTNVARFTGATNAYIDLTDGIVNTRIQNSGGSFIGTTTDHSLYFRTNSQNRIQVSNTGTVGIGTDATGDILTVAREDTVGPSIQLRRGAAQRAWINNWGSGQANRTNRFEINATEVGHAWIGAAKVVLGTNVGDGAEALTVESTKRIVLDGPSIKMPTGTTDPTNAVAGETYYNTADGVLKTYDGAQWRNAGNAPVYTDTFDYLQDGSALSLHRFNNNGNPSPDSGGVYPATFFNGVTYTTTSKFGSHAINTMGDGTYCDIAGLPLIEAVSIWYYCVGTDNGYIVDFRHDGPSNGRSYLYTHAGGGDQHIDWGDDTTTTGRTGDMWINGQVFNSGQYNFFNGNWYHIVMSRNATDTHRQWDQGIRIGNRSDGTTEGNAGYFDQVRTFNRPLTQEDVDLLYNEQERP